LIRPLTAAVSELAASEYQALHDLYDATGGPSWLWPYYPAVEWDFSGNSDPCEDQWQGVTCVNNTVPNHVIRLDLHEQNLRGSLPGSMGGFPMMTELALYYNYLVGEIPQAMVQLSQLESIDLSDNSLTGAFPEWICSLDNLQSLKLNDNTISGTIPEAISNLTELQYFNVYSNAMSGLVPESIGDLSKLQVLLLGSAGTDPFYNSSVNSFHGPLPLSFG